MRRETSRPEGSSLRGPPARTETRRKMTGRGTVRGEGGREALNWTGKLAKVRRKRKEGSSELNMR